MLQRRSDNLKGLILFGLLFVTVLSGCSRLSVDQRQSLKTAFAQKIMLDMRYYCADGYDEKCTEPMTQLPDELAQLITDSQLGGVILFAENLANFRQILELNHSLQFAAKRSANQVPLFIGIDQEGGRVARLPRRESAAFSGAMAIGATYSEHGTEFAKLTGEIIAKELKALGFNLNFAPTVDVNVNPENPVINVRSFGEDAELVAKLGYEQLSAMQTQGIIATLKHFPGHGDTNVDSHTGLPRVDHDFDSIMNLDLAPFQYAIERGNVDMIMTAHIQYPELDNDTFIAIDGTKTIKPATMSQKILRGILRDVMGYKGLIITDALDMAGISHFFAPTQAVIETFKAGADIALMPIKIRSKAEIAQLDQLLNDLVDAVEQGELNADEITKSSQRIVQTKAKYGDSSNAMALEDKWERAQQLFPNVSHKALEQKLADEALTVTKGNAALASNQMVHLLLPDNAKCQALVTAMTQRFAADNISCSSQIGMNLDEQKALIAKQDVLIVASVAPKQSLVELGGFEDISWQDYSKIDLKQQKQHLLNLMVYGKNQGKKTVFISLRTPYEMSEFAEVSDSLIATFAYDLHYWQDEQGKQQAFGTSFEALAKLFAGEIIANGQLPVSVQEFKVMGD